MIFYLTLLIGAPVNAEQVGLDHSCALSFFA